MHARSRFALCLFASLALCACGKEAASAPASAVAATLDGEKITVDDLRAEGGPNASVTEYGPLLERVINRKLMAKAMARDPGGKSAEAQAAAERIEDAARAAAYAAKVSSEQKAPTAQEVQSYMAAHPIAFAQRKFLLVEQIELKRSDRPAELPNPIASLDQVQAALDAKGAPYQRTMATVDSASTAPQVVEQLGSMAQGAVFEMGDATNAVIGRVTDVRPMPFTGALARSVAANLIRNQAAAEAVRDSTAQLKQAAKIKYEAGYEPSK